MLTIFYKLYTPSTVIEKKMKLKITAYSLSLTHLFPAPTKVSQHLSIVKISLFPYFHTPVLCHPPSKKMAAFHTYVNIALKICSDPISINSEIQYLRAIALDRGYNP